MKRRIAIYLALCLSLCLGALLFRADQSDALSGTLECGECILGYMPYDTLAWEENKAVILEGLDGADAIVCARFTGERQAMYRSTLSVATVAKVWRGDEALLGQNVAVYERGFFQARAGTAYYRPGGVENLMHEGGEYILFLKRLQTRRGTLDGPDEYTMDWAFSELRMDLPCLIPLTERPEIRVVTQEEIVDGSLRYGDIQAADYLCDDLSVVQDVLARNEEIRARFGLY